MLEDNQQSQPWRIYALKKTRVSSKLWQRVQTRLADSRRSGQHEIRECPFGRYGTPRGAAERLSVHPDSQGHYSLTLSSLRLARRGHSRKSAQLVAGVLFFSCTQNETEETITRVTHRHRAGQPAWCRAPRRFEKPPSQAQAPRALAVSRLETTHAPAARTVCRDFFPKVPRGCHPLTLVGTNHRAHMTLKTDRFS